MALAQAQDGGVHEHDNSTITSITVSVPEHDPESLQVAASCPLVGATPCLPWSAHGRHTTPTTGRCRLTCGHASVVSGGRPTKRGRRAPRT
eukprot:7384821-Prymnesium_polylepis.4